MKTNKINLKVVGRRYIDLQQFKNSLLNGLGDNLFLINDKTDFIYQCLKQIHPVSRHLVNEHNSIENTCKTIVQHFYPISTTRISPLARDKEKSYRDNFFSKVLMFERLPSVEYIRLEQSVKGDLRELASLIEYYEALPEVRTYNENKSSSKRDHETKTIIDFYKRCIEEQKKIVDFYLNHLERTALNKAHVDYKRSTIAISDAIRPKPYHFNNYNYDFEYSISYFDHRQINKVIHRIYPHMYWGQMEYYVKLYQSNKNRFYKELFKREPPQKMFKSIDLYMRFLPMKSNRKTIFNRLKRLFINKDWISFCALALPQIEGVFGEMYNLVGQEKVKGNLLDKVSSIRKFTFYRPYLDYYQYYIPTIRNKFAHTGLMPDSNYRLNTYDLLVDLCRLFEIFHELKHPYVQIRRIHEDRDPTRFQTIKQFNNYFKLLQELSKEQTEEISDDIQDFERTFLTKQCNLDLLCSDLDSKLREEFTQFRDSLDQFAKVVLRINHLTNNSQKENDKIINSDKSGHLKSFFHSHEIEYSTIDTGIYFLQNYKKRLPSITPSIVETLNKLAAEYVYVGKKIVYIANKLGIENVDV